MIAIGIVLAVVLVFMFAGRMAGMFSGVSVKPSAVGGGQASIKGLGLVDSIMREGDISSVDTWTALQNVGATSVGDVKVPMDAKALSRIDVMVSADMDTPAGGLGSIAAFRLSGNALMAGGVHRYLAHAFTAGGKTAGEAACRSKVISMPMKVPVKGGNELGVEGIMLGEDSGTFTMSIVFTFTKELRENGIEDGDFREGDITGVDTDTILTSVGATSLGNIKVPVERSLIAAVCGVFAVDVGADNTATVRCIGSYQVSSTALKSGGVFRSPGEALQITATTTGVFLAVMEPDPTPLDMEVKGGNELELHAMFLGEDPGQMTMAVGVLYGTSEGEISF